MYSRATNVVVRDRLKFWNILRVSWKRSPFVQRRWNISFFRKRRNNGQQRNMEKSKDQKAVKSFASRIPSKETRGVYFTLFLKIFR